MATVDTTNLMDQVYNFFRHLYPSSTPDAFLVFEHLGLPVNPEDFQFNGVECAPMGVEWTSTLANKALIFTGGSAYHSTTTVDGLVGLMLNASQPVSADDMPVLGAAKSDANTRFQITLNSLSGIPNDEFHPVVSSPANWYDPDQQCNWTPYSVGQTPPPTPAPVTPTPVPVRPILWHLPPAAAPSNGGPVRPIPIRAGGGFPPGRQMLPMMAAHPAALSMPAATPQPPKPAAVDTAAAPGLNAATLAALRAPVLLQHQQQTSALLANPAIRNVVTTEAPARLANLHLMLDNAAAPTASPAPAQAVASSSISMTFEYCVVNLSWPWLSQAFLLLRDWYLPGFAQNSISNGTGSADESGLLPVLPSAFLAIRKVEVNAQWKEADVSAIQAGAGFGPFALSGSQFQAATGKLTIPGMQIVGWFCSALPPVPPADDPRAK